MDDANIENMSNEEIIDAFLEGLLIEKNLGEMDEDTKKEMLADLKERLYEFINRAILESLPEEKLAEINSMADDNTINSEILTQKVEASGIDATKITIEAMDKFREVYLGNNESQGA